MKKALVILLALSMVFAAFADEPAVKNEIIEFKGSATVTWGVNLDTSKTGFENAEEANLKFTLIGSGDKTSTGSGVWGDIKIKFADDEQFDGGAWGNKTAAVDYAKIHLNDMIAIGIRSGSNTYGEYGPVTAVMSPHDKTDKVGGTVTQGITLEVALPDLLDFNLEFRSKPVLDATDKITNKYTNDYGIGAKFALSDKVVDGLNFSVGFGMDLFDPKPWGLAVAADYKLGLNETMYLKPQVGYSMTNADKSGVIAAALLFGWGSEGQEAKIHFIDNKQADGVSVATKIALADTKTIPLCVGVWDTTFVENLKAGVLFHVNSLSAFAMNSLAFEFAYDLGGIKPTLAFAINDKGCLDTKTKWTKLYFGVDFTGFVDNTTFSLVYESGDLGATKAEIGTINISAKVSL